MVLRDASPLPRPRQLFQLMCGGRLPNRRPCMVLLIRAVLAPRVPCRVQRDGFDANFNAYVQFLSHGCFLLDDDGRMDLAKGSCRDLIIAERGLAAFRSLAWPGKGMILLCQGLQRAMECHQGLLFSQRPKVPLGCARKWSSPTRLPFGRVDEIMQLMKELQSTCTYHGCLASSTAGDM